MTYYLYRKDDNRPCCCDHEIPVPPPGWTLVRTSEQPFNVEGMIFDATGKLVMDLAALRRHKKLEVDGELRARVSQPVTFDGSVLDADANAVEAIKAKLVELDVRTPPLPELYWRDSGNFHRHFDTPEAYRAFLVGALAAILARNSEAQAWAFATKSKIEAQQNPVALGAMAVMQRGSVPAQAVATVAVPSMAYVSPPVHPDSAPPPVHDTAQAPPGSVAEPDRQG